MYFLNGGYPPVKSVGGIFFVPLGSGAVKAIWERTDPERD